MELDAVRRALSRLYLDEHDLRREDAKKARELAALLDEVARLHRGGVIVDAAAGHGYVGLLAIELAGASRVVVLERDPARVERSRGAAGRLARPAEVEVRCAPLSDLAAWPAEPQLVVALHACGAASDDAIAGAVATRARWLLLVPCCYGKDPRAEAIADRIGIARAAEVRRRFVQSFVDSARTWRLEAAGYEVTVTPFVPPTVTPHNALWRARRVGEPTRMAAAAAALARLNAG